jgi:hypothetical protein
MMAITVFEDSGRRMFKLESEILLPDPRFAALRTVNAPGISAAAIVDHYRHVEEVSIIPVAPLEVRASFDRARNVFLYAWFCYELLVVSELQAFGALELALKLKLLGVSQKISSLGKLLRLARRKWLLPPSAGAIDQFDALLFMRNALAHGALEVHTPEMSLTVLLGCAEVINQLYVTSSD